MPLRLFFKTRIKKIEIENRALTAQVEKLTESLTRAQQQSENQKRLQHAHARQELLLNNKNTELKKSTASLQEQLEQLQAENTWRYEIVQRFNALAEYTQDLICETDINGRHLYISPNCSTILGYSPDALIGKPLSNFIHPDDVNKTVHTLRRIIDSLTAEQILFRFQHQQGYWVWFENSCAAFRCADGTIRVIAILRDISQRKLAEDELVMAQNLASLGVLAGGIAHDFNNILTAILVNISTARMDINENDAPNALLRNAQNACHQARDLTRKLLTFSQRDASEKRATTIATLIKETVEFTLQGSKVKCKFKLADNLWPVEIDEAQISQVLSDMILNADQAMPDGGTIKIQAESTEQVAGDESPLKPGKYVRIAIEDNGVGIPESIIGQIFDPYFSTKIKCSGLSLAMCHSIIKNHGGHIAAASQKGNGTGIFIYLPATPGAQIETDATNELGILHQGSGRILVMDDEIMVRSSIEKLLTRLGYSVILAENGEEAIELYRESLENNDKFDVVIIDLTIADGMGGLETVSELKGLDAEIKAIVASGYEDAPEVRNFADHGFANVLKKPFEPWEVSQKLQALLA